MGLLTRSRIYLLLVVVLLLGACGGGGGSDDGIDGTGLSGTAATGAPIVDQNVFIRGKRGKKFTTTTDAQGKYQATFTGLEAPFLLKVERPEQPALYSVAMAGGVANIHPFTDFLIRNWFALEGRDIDAVFDSDELVQPQAQRIAEIQLVVNNLIKHTYGQFDLDSDFDFITSPFNADTTGFDAVLDVTIVNIHQTNVTINIIDPITNIQATIVDQLGLDTDITQADTQDPTQPQELLVLPAGEATLVVTWLPSSDDIGVAGYNVYRDGELLNTAPYPVYRDSGLLADTQYCYSVEAVDASGRTSARTTDVCATVSGQMDDTPPATVTNLDTGLVSQSSIELLWTPATDDDVLGYHIYKDVAGELQRVSTVVASTFVDSGLVADTEYCYEVQTFDAVGNTSTANASVCTTTVADGGVDAFAPTTTASPGSGVYSAAINVALGCSDTGGSGCATTYYTTDDTAPDTSSMQYTGEIPIAQTTTLRFFSVDVAGNSELEKQAVYTINIPPPPSTFTLTVNSTDALGYISSDASGIDCGQQCSAQFAANSNVVLTASHASGLVPVWSACQSVNANTCTVKMNADISVGVNFALAASENEPNDTVGGADSVSGITRVSGFFNTATDSDYYRIDVSEAGTFYAHISHPTVASYMYLYNDQQQQLLRVGSSLARDHVLDYSLAAGTYYLRVDSYGNSSDVVQTYTLDLYGTVLGGVSPDAQEENDFISTATAIGSVQTVAGYFDTRNDNDYYRIDVSAAGTFSASISHDTVASYMFLYNSSQQQLVRTGSSTARAHTLNYSLSPGTYYLLVVSYGTGSSLDSAYSLDFEGTVLGGTTADNNEENDFFSSATAITSAGAIDGFFDTRNDTDYYRIEVAAAGTLHARISHNTLSSYMYLYDGNQTQLVRTGSSVATSHTLNYSLTPGTYYLMVTSYNTGYSLLDGYSLDVSGTVLGSDTPDVHEENDSFSSATLVSSVSDLQGFFNTRNDTDYYRFEVTDAGTFSASILHNSVASYMYLYDGNQTQLLRTGGSLSLGHTLNYSLSPGTYYLMVTSYNIGYDLDNAYALNLSGTVLGGSTSDVNEQNDFFDSATVVSSVSSVSGFFDTRNDTDYYTIEVTEAGTFSVDISHNTVPSYMYLYDSNQQQLVRTGGSTSLGHTLNYSLTPGTYYLMVTSYQNGFDLDSAYSLDFSGTVLGATSPDSNEQNDFNTSATLVSAVGEVTGYFDTRNDTDYFRIDVAAAGTFSVDISHNTVPSFMYLYDAALQQLVRTGGATGLAHTLNYSLEPGTYYLLVASYQNGYNLVDPYNLQFSGTVLGGTTPDTNEENNFVDSATLVASVSTVSGYFDTRNDTDYYRINVAAAGSFRVDISHIDVPSYMYLYDASQQQLLRTGGALSTAHTLDYSLAVGTYYLMVTSYQNGYDLTNAYSLDFSGTVLGSVSPDTNEENNFFSSAGSVTMGSTVQGYFDTRNDDDYYTFTLESAGTFSASITHNSVASYMYLYDGSQAQIVRTGGPNNTAHTLTRDLAAGTYYVRVVSYLNQSDLSSAYNLQFSVTP